MSDSLHRNDLIWLFLIALFLRALAAWPQAQPGYMDAAYYTLGAQRLAQGQGFTEIVLWNYLDDPQGLPHPSHLYWQPLPSLLAAGPMAVFGTGYRAAQAAFVLLAALVPPLAYAVSWGLARNRRQAWAAGGLALFSGFYVIFWGVPEAFAPYALFGGLCLAAAGLGLRTGQARWFLVAGACAALGHLSRADGVLLVGAVAALVLAQSIRSWKKGERGAGSGERAVRSGTQETEREIPRANGILASTPPASPVNHPLPAPHSPLPVLALLTGYLVVMAPWFWRNVQVMGQPLPTAGSYTLWLRSYDEIFSYGALPNPATYFAWGWDNILGSKLQALWQNLLNFVAVNNLIFLTPFTLIGLRRAWRHALILPALVYGLLLYAAMTFAFTFPGMRGGVFHSSSALMPALLAVAADGLDRTVAWVARRRRAWRATEAQAAFAAGAVLLAAALSGWLYVARVLGPGGLSDPTWNHADEAYLRVGDFACARDPRATGGGPARPVLMVNNPPSFTYLTGCPSVVLPNERLPVVLAAARRYGVTYLVLDSGRPAPLAQVYDGTLPAPGLREVLSFVDRAGQLVRVFQVEAGP